MRSSAEAVRNPRPSSARPRPLPFALVPILGVLKRIFTEAGYILEIGSGTGQHAVYFAPNLPHVTWQASDLPAELAGIEAWRREAALANLPPPLALDVQRYPWPVARVNGAFSANTTHI